MTRMPMSELQLQAAILEEARIRRLLAFHIRDSRKNIGVGFPDLVIVGPGGVIFRELKNARNQPTPEQMVWLGTLEQAGADVALWRPDKWFDGTVTQTLTRLARPRKDGAT